MKINRYPPKYLFITVFAYHIIRYTLTQYKCSNIFENAVVLSHDSFIMSKTCNNVRMNQYILLKLVDP